MNALIATDLHAHNWPIGRMLPNGRNSRFQDLLNILDQMSYVLQREKIDHVFLGGDILHRRHFIGFRLFNALQYKLEVSFERAKKSSVVITGNHDLEDAETSGITPLGYMRDVVAVSGQPFSSNAESFTFIPYMDDPAQMIQAFETSNPDFPILAHYAAAGCPLENDYYLASPIPLGMLDRFPRVLFGHVHKPSVQCPEGHYQNAITSGEQKDINTCPICGRPPVVYLGAPYHMDFGDKGPRFLWRLENTQLRGLPTEFPMFITATYPKLPSPSAAGYLRILNVPPAVDGDVKAKAKSLGWLDVVTTVSALPAELTAMISAGLIVGDDLIRDYVARKLPDLNPVEQATMVTEGLSYLQEARS